MKRKEGKGNVVMMELGFVDTVMATVVADATDKKGQPMKFVIGMQRSSTRSYWKILLLNRGVSPTGAMERPARRHQSGWPAGRLADGTRPV